MNNTQNSLVLQADGDAAFLEHSSFMKLIPEDFAVKSFAQRKIAVDPQTDFNKIIGNVKGCKLEQLHSSDGYDEAFLSAVDHFVFAHARKGHVTLKIAASNFKAKEIVAVLASQFDCIKMENEEEDGVWVDFSHMGQYGATKTMEFLKCPKWSDIKDNYPTAVSNGLSRLIGMPDPWTYGRLLIWNGNPGTGKTYTVRSLMMEWRKQFDFLVITDPERFAQDPTYYYSVASEVKDRPAARRMIDDDDYAMEPGRDDEQKGKRLLFILEDSADLILQESRASHYDKVGKLLNMTDGLFGQGREDIFLITFNEQVDRIDPAFLRPGRCISNIEFLPFQQEEAAVWIKKHGAAYKPRTPMTLAEMYSKVLAEKGDGPISVQRDRSGDLLMKPKAGFGG